MPRVSKHPLDKKLEHEVFVMFWESVSQLHTAADVSGFFSDVLSDTEEMMLAKRFAVAILLEKGKKPVDIAANLHVSFSLIRSVESWVSRANPQTQRVIARVLKLQKLQGVVDRVEGALDSLPPRRNSDWSKAGKEKWKRKLERASRKILR